MPRRLVLPAEGSGPCDYRILGRIDAQPDAWEAEQPALRRRVALRRRRGDQDPEAFIAEARAVAALAAAHPAVVPVLDVACDQDGAALCATRLVAATPLPDVLAGLGPDARADTVLRCAETVAAAHALGHAHCALAPLAVALGAFGETWLHWIGQVRRAGRQERAADLAGLRRIAALCLRGDDAALLDGDLAELAAAADAAGFAAALAAWIANRPAAAALAAAERLAAEARGSLAELARAEAACAEALELRPGWAAALATRARLRGERVARAIAVDALDAAATAASGDASLEAQVAAARARRAAEQAGFADLARRSAERAAASSRVWQTVLEEDFSAAGWEARWELHGGSQIAGALRLAGGAPSVLRLRQPLAGDLRISVILAAESEPDDLAVFLAADAGAELKQMPRSGYELKLAWEGNRLATIFRLRERLRQRLIEPLPDGWRGEVLGERSGGALRLARDGATVLAAEDAAGLSGSAIGISTWGRAPLHVVRIRVEILAPARRGDLLAIAGWMREQGRLSAARDLCDDVAAAGDAERGRRAQELRAAIDAEEARSTAIEAQADRLRNRFGERARLQRGGGSFSLQLVLEDGEDLVPLAGLPLHSLQVRGPLRSLAPLAGSPLRHLDINDTLVSDLAPLAGLPLETLEITRCPLTGSGALAALAGMSLRDLRCAMTPCSDLAALAGAPLERLLLDRCPVSDLGPLAGAPLHTLGLDCVRDLDLAPIARAPIDILSIEDAGIRDLDALAGSSLRIFWAQGSALASLGPFLARPTAWCAIPLRGLPESELVIAAAWPGDDQDRRHARFALALARGDGAAALAQCRQLADGWVATPLPLRPEELDDLLGPAGLRMAEPEEAMSVALPTSLPGLWTRTGGTSVLLLRDPARNWIRSPPPGRPPWERQLILLRRRS